MLGSTESSRAVAAIIELIKDEFKKPGSGKDSEFVGYLDLFSGTVGFVLLQRWGRRKTEREFHERDGEEVIWDAVIDDKGFRADVVGTQRTRYPNGIHKPAEDLLQRGRPVSFVSPAGDEAIDAIERGTIYESANISLPAGSQVQLSDEEVREHIMKQLPDGCHAVISSETITAKTIRVDLYNTGMTDVTAPPGTVVIREHFHHTENDKLKGEQHTPSQTIVLRTALRRTSSADIEPLKDLRLTSSNHAHPETPYDSDDAVTMRNTTAPRQLQLDDFESHPDRTVSSPYSGSESGHELEYSNHAPAKTYTASLVPVANQKKARRPVPPSTSKSDTVKPTVLQPMKTVANNKIGTGSIAKHKKVDQFRKALKSLSPSSSSARFEGSASTPPAEQDESETDKNTSGNQVTHFSQNPRFPSSSLGSRNKSLPEPPIQQTDRTSTGMSSSPKVLRSIPSQAFFSIRDKRHDTVVHETETFTTHSFESRPGSPTIARTHSRTTSGLSKTKSERDSTTWDPAEGMFGDLGENPQRKSRSFLASSLYSVAANGSETSLILAPKGPIPQASIFDDHEVLSALAAEGKVPGIFPNNHLVRNVRRYARFSSASYGSQFLRFMGLTASAATPHGALAQLEQEDVHFEHSSFSLHTGLPPDTILLSSFEDPHGGMGFSQSPSSALPLVHFISIDHESKAVVLTCRGTLGFEDVLTDMLCDFDDLYWRGKSYKVHKGIHASARRMLSGTGSRVMTTLKAALEEYSDFGLILTGHSLGGAVASLLAILISEPSTLQETGALFATTTAQKLIAHPDLTHPDLLPPITLPASRPIHVYAYGPPATLSPSLRLATRGLITTIVNANDIVPTLSLGILHDFRAVALNLKHDTTGAIAALKARVWARVRHAAQSAFYVDGSATLPPPPENTAGDGIGEDTWAWAALKTLRAGMSSEKLVPPGEVFVVETTRVFDRQAVFTGGGGVGGVTSDSATERVFKSLGRPATRVQLKLIRDVEGRFGELRFGSRMFSDHSPARYEAGLAALETGILEG